MTPIPIDKDIKEEIEKIDKELKDKLIEMPELEDYECKHAMNPETCIDCKEDELIHKRMNNINTFQAHENEVYLRGTDEYGKDFQICFDSYNFRIY